MTLPPLQFTSTAASGAESGALSASAMFDSSGMNVNFGNGASLGGALPAVNPLVLGAALLALIVWKKKFT